MVDPFSAGFTILHGVWHYTSKAKKNNENCQTMVSQAEQTLKVFAQFDNKKLEPATIEAIVQLMEALNEAKPAVDKCSDSNYVSAMYYRQTHASLLKRLAKKIETALNLIEKTWNKSDTKSTEESKEQNQTKEECESSHSTSKDAKDNDRWTLLHIAVQKNFTDVVEILIASNPKIDLQNKDGWTPLHIGAACGRLEIVKILLEHGASKFIRNSTSETPLEVVCSDESFGPYDDMIIEELKALLSDDP